MKYKVFTLINVLGLTVGTTCSGLILLWVIDEYKVDAFNEESHLIYSIYERQFYEGKIEAGFFTPGILADELKKVMPEVAYASGGSWSHWYALKHGGNSMKTMGTYAGEDFFKIFSFPVIQGTKENVFVEPDGIAISRKVAHALFGSVEAAMNKKILVDHETELTVQLVYDIPKNASSKYDFLINWDLFLAQNRWANDWTNNGPLTNIKLKAGTDPAQFSEKIKYFLDDYNDKQTKEFRIELGMQRFDEKYLYSNFKNGEIAGGRIEYVRMFSITAIFILLIACVNFINLTTARSTKRAKEIGVRKVIGAMPFGLIRQFITESILIALIAVLIAFLSITVLLPSFNELTNKQIILPYSAPILWVGLLIMALFIGFLSGSYPAFLLSSFKPTATLKSSKNSDTGGAWLRKGLVVFQFALSIIFVVGTLVISKQVNYIHNINLGYDKNDLLYMPIEGGLVNKFDVFKEEAIKIPGISSVSQISQRPVEMENGTSGVDWDGKDPESTIMFTHMAVGYDFVKNLKLEILEGRGFSKDYGMDSSNYILNQAAVEKIGYADPVGKRLSFWGDEGKIIGVVKDFHFNSLYVPIEPLIIRLGQQANFSYAAIRVNKVGMESAVPGLEKLWNKFVPGYPFALQYADQEYADIYKAEFTTQKLSNYFAFIAIFISCLGLLGLAMFTAEQRTREIGIRKVMGANLKSLFSLLTKEYITLMAVGFIISVPIAIWILDLWLTNFAYRISVSWWFFALSGLLVFAIGMITVSFQVVKTSVTSPVKSLRSE